MNNRLKEIRTKRNLSMNELARISGVAQSTISKIETGDMIPSQLVMCKICTALNLGLDDVFGCK